MGFGIWLKHHGKMWKPTRQIFLWCLNWLRFRNFEALILLENGVISPIPLTDLAHPVWLTEWKCINRNIFGPELTISRDMRFHSVHHTGWAESLSGIGLLTQLSAKIRSWLQLYCENSSLYSTNFSKGYFFALSSPMTFYTSVTFDKFQIPPLGSVMFTLVSSL